jgi:hypothetical protein
MFEMKAAVGPLHSIVETRNQKLNKIDFSERRSAESNLSQSNDFELQRHE